MRMSGMGAKVWGCLGASVVAVAAMLGFASSASALVLDPVGTFDSPLYVTSDPSDPNRLFVVEQQGQIQLLDHGVEHTFLDIRGAVVGGGEQGLLSMAFDPGYATNHRFYVYYTMAGPGDFRGDIRIAEYTANASGNAAPASSQRPLLTIEHSQFGNHNGGQLQIGPDGYLYAGTGDGGGGGDTLMSGQNLDTLLGKILRIDPDPGPGGAQYTIPPDNPFAGATRGLDQIWSYGMRNPWRFSFDSATGALAIGDVGQGAWEEIDYRPQAIGGGRGINFGWNDCEGTHLYGADGPCNLAGHTNPVFEYDHDHRCAIVGGFVDRDPGTPGYAGRYWYSDSCDGELRTLRPGNGTAAATDDRSEGISTGSPSSFGQDSCGRLYVADLADGTVSRIEGATPTDCGGTEPPPPPPPGDNGPCAPSSQLGDEGPDQFTGTDFEDQLTGNGGDDALIGLGGDDCLAGGDGADSLAAGSGEDDVYGGPGGDEIFTGRNKDRIWARDGVRDEIRCGKGKKDFVRADAADEVAANCERVHRSGA